MYIIYARTELKAYDKIKNKPIRLDWTIIIIIKTWTSSFTPFVHTYSYKGMHRQWCENTLSCFENFEYIKYKGYNLQI